VLSHLFELALPSAGTGNLPAVMRDTQNLLVFRVFMFSLLPLILSLRLMNKLGIALDRETLRPVFYSQCFVTAPITMLIGIATVFARAGGEVTGIISWLLFGGGLVWYLAQQTLWFRTKLGIGTGAAVANAVGTTLVAAIIISVTALAAAFGLGGVIAA
jgi:hypothetical protein